MPSFEEEFRKVKGIAPIKYKGLELVRLVKIPVKKKFSGNLKLISTNSEYKQAIIIASDDRKKKNLVIGSQKERSFIIWEDDFEDDVICFEGTSKNSELLVYNAWEQISWQGVPFANSLYHGAAMIVEANGNTWKCKCNDGHPDDNFDDIVFEVAINDVP